MKKLLTIALVAVMAMAGAQQASAQFHVGPKVGLCVNSLKFDKDILDSDNRAGFTGGIMAEFTVPVIGVGFDASVMYVRRSSKYMFAMLDSETGEISSEQVNNGRSYINVPINLKYKIGIPAISKFFVPFLTTGPDFAFLCSKKGVDGFLEGKTFDFSWNFGLGFEVMSHFQIAASYGLGLTKAVETVSSVEGAGIQGKNRYWTVTAAYLF